MEWEEGKAVVSCRRCLADLVFCGFENVSLHMKFGFGPASMYGTLEAYDTDDERVVFCAVCGHHVGKEVLDVGVHLQRDFVVEKRYVERFPGRAWRWCCAGCGADVCLGDGCLDGVSEYRVPVSGVFNTVIESNDVFCRICDGRIGRISAEEPSLVLIKIGDVTWSRGKVSSERLIPLTN